MTRNISSFDGACPPVIILIYRRAALTKAAIESLRQTKPTRLYVVADGPKNEEENESVQATRRVVESGVDWECDVRWNAADQNMGLASRVSTGISWAFESCSEAIILEDDCVASSDFFRFCVEMLERYASDERVMAITGDNFQGGNRRGFASYYFSMYPHCWGWATWKRAWRHYDHTLSCWAETEEFLESLKNERFLKYWTKRKDGILRGDVDSWAYRWMFSIWARGGLTVTPNVNLVENIGFGEDATNCRGVDRKVPGKGQLEFPLRHPWLVRRNRKADSFVSREWFKIP